MKPEDTRDKSKIIITTFMELGNELMESFELEVAPQLSMCSLILLTFIHLYHSGFLYHDCSLNSRQFYHADKKSMRSLINSNKETMCVSLLYYY